MSVLFSKLQLLKVELRLRIIVEDKGETMLKLNVEPNLNVKAKQ